MAVLLERVPASLCSERTLRHRHLAATAHGHDEVAKELRWAQPLCGPHPSWHSAEPIACLRHGPPFASSLPSRCMSLSTERNVVSGTLPPPVISSQRSRSSCDGHGGLRSTWLLGRCGRWQGATRCRKTRSTAAQPSQRGARGGVTRLRDRRLHGVRLCNGQLREGWLHAQRRSMCAWWARQLHLASSASMRAP